MPASCFTRDRGASSPPGSSSTGPSSARWPPSAIRPRSSTHLETIPRLAAGDPSAGPIARLSRPERFHWLVSPSSTIVQPSEVHTGLTDDPAATLEHLFATLVRGRR